MESTFTKCEHPNFNPPFSNVVLLVQNVWAAQPAKKCKACLFQSDLPPHLPNRHQSSESLHCRRLTKEFDIKSCVFPILANMQVPAAGARSKQDEGQDRTVLYRTEQTRTGPYRTEQDRTITIQDRTGPYLYRTEQDKTGSYYTGQKRLGQAKDRKCRPALFS